MPKITLINLFKQYPYKCPDSIKQQGRNWIPVKDVKCDSKYSIDLKTYKDIIKNCFDVIIEEYLLKGRVVTLPYNFGELQIKRYKPTNWKKAGIDWKATNENIKNGIRQYVYFSLAHSEGYRWCMTWIKTGASFVGSRFWRIHLHPKTRKRISKEVINNPLLINKFNLR